MDYKILVEKQIDEGRLFLIELDKANLEIRAAFWFYDEDNSSWKFFVASSSSKLDVKKNILEAYGTLTEVLRSISNLSFISASDIVLIPLDHPLIKNIGPLIKTGSEIGGISFSNTLLNQIYVEGIYLYRMDVT